MSIISQWRGVWWRLLSGATLVSALAAGATLHAQEVLKVGTNRALGTITPYVGKAQGFFAREQQEISLVTFSEGSTVMEALAAGELDVALLGIAPCAIWKSKGVGFKIVASANGGGHVLLTRDDTGIHSLADLKGRKVATPRVGMVVDTLFRAHIVKKLAGLDPDNDLRIVAGVDASDIPIALLAARQVDAAITWEPFASQAQSQFPHARVLFDAAAEWRKAHPGKPLYPVNVVVASQKTLVEKPEALRRFLRGYLRTIDLINQQPQVVNPIIARETKLDEAIVTHARQRIEYTARVDIPAAMEIIQWSYQLGYLKAMPKSEALFDLSFLPAETGK